MSEVSNTFINGILMTVQWLVVNNETIHQFFYFLLEIQKKILDPKPGDFSKNGDSKRRLHLKKEGS